MTRSSKSLALSDQHDGACQGGCGDVFGATDRRSFLSVAAASAIALALAACGDGQIGPITGVSGPTTGTPLSVRVADFAALGAVGGVARVTTTGTPIAVYRSADATYLAFSMRCPHAGTTVRITATGFTCPNHNARFGKDGAWLGGQRSSALVLMPVTFDPVTGTLSFGTAAPPPGPGGDDDDDDR
jgi:nitrite reductase/ring-hydroxylating ferredoxin subunit